MTEINLFDENTPLSYLGLPQDYEPSPKTSAIPFLIRHLSQLPPHILLHFSYITTPKQRTIIPNIRNRRLRYTRSNPEEFEFNSARAHWPSLWDGRDRQNKEEAIEEREWVESSFLQGSVKHVGKLGNLLGDYEEEREAERARILRRERAANNFVPEEDSDSDEDDISEDIVEEELESTDDMRARFERRIQENFIYGLLDNIDYDQIDWDDSLDDDDDREVQDRWFDDDDE